jgi:hypothetical protein
MYSTYMHTITAIGQPWGNTQLDGKAVLMHILTDQYHQFTASILASSGELKLEHKAHQNEPILQLRHSGPIAVTAGARITIVSPLGKV